MRKRPSASSDTRMSNFMTCDSIDACSHVDAKWLAFVLVMFMPAMLPVFSVNDAEQTCIVKALRLYGDCYYYSVFFLLQPLAAFES